MELQILRLGIRKKMLTENSEKNFESKIELENNLNKAKKEIKILKSELIRLNEENQKISRAKQKAEDEAKKANSSRRLTSFILVLVTIISLVVCYNFYVKYNDFRKELDGIKLELKELMENSERKSQVENILSALNNDNISRFFYNSNSLEYVDSVKDFYAKDIFTETEAKNVVAGNLNSKMPLNFCREYSDSNSLNAFFNSEGLKSAMKTFNTSGEVSVRSDKRFIFPTNSTSWTQKINLLEKSAFFSVQTLKPAAGSFITNIVEKIFDALKKNPDDSVFRFYFKTAEKDLYIVSIVSENKLLGTYLVSNSQPLQRYSIIRELHDTTKQNNFNAESTFFEISLRNSDSRLNNETDFDTCLDIFISQLKTKGDEAR